MLCQIKCIECTVSLRLDLTVLYFSFIAIGRVTEVGGYFYLSCYVMQMCFLHIPTPPETPAESGFTDRVTILQHPWSNWG